MMNKFFLSLLLFATIFIVACSDASQNMDSQSKAANGNQSNRSEETQTNGSKIVKAEGTVAVIPPAANNNQPAPQPNNPLISGKAPKLFLPVTNADYGKIKAEKSFTRTFDVKNTGNAPLNIETVTPG